MPSPLTIVISSYNYGHYIGQAIESVVNQTSPEWQLVIFDNRSTDNTLDVIKPYLADPRVSLVIRDTNIGARNNVSQAIQSITTEFAAHLQADDFLDPHFVESALQMLRENPESPFVFFNWHHLLSEKDEVADHQGLPMSRERRGLTRISPLLTIMNFVPLHMVVFRTTCLLSCWNTLMDSPMTQVGEQFLLKLLEDQYGPGCFSGIFGGTWRRHSSQMTATNVQSMAASIEEPLERLWYLDHTGLRGTPTAFMALALFVGISGRSDLPTAVDWLLNPYGRRLAASYGLDIERDGEHFRNLAVTVALKYAAYTEYKCVDTKALHEWLERMGRQPTAEALRALLVETQRQEGEALLSDAEIDEMVAYSFEDREPILNVASAYDKSIGTETRFAHRRHKRHAEYRQWVERRTLQEGDVELMAVRMIKRWTRQPRFLILMPCTQPELPLLHRTIESLQKQFYRNWCLIIVSDCPSPDPIFIQTDVLGWLQVDSLEDDATLVSAFNQVAGSVPSEWLTVIPAGTTFEPNWMITTGDYINIRPKWAVIYTDDDQIDVRGERHSPRMKPEFNLDYLRSMDYIGSSCWFRTEHFLEMKGFGAFPGALQYDLILRLFDVCGREVIGHIADPLLHYPNDKPHPLAEHAARAALEDHLARNHLVAEIGPGYAPMTRHVVYRHERQPMVSIIIPNRDNFGFLKPCIDSVFSKTEYPAFEVIVVDNQSVDPDVLAFYEEMRQQRGTQFSVIEYDHPFNFSAQCNLGAEAAKGEYLLFLNNDTEIIQPAWLSRMMAFGQRPDVGVVGARLVYPEDGGIQHAGVIAGLGQLAAHPYQGTALDEAGYMNRLHVDQNFSAVTAACMLVRRSVYQEVGGMDAENLKVLYNDIDLCFKAGEAGYLTVWTPHVTVIHLEHKSLEVERQQFDLSPVISARNIKSRDYMHARWKDIIANDPAYNRQLSLCRGDFAIDPVLVADWDTNFHDVPRVLAFPPAGGVGEYRFYAPLKGLSHTARVQSTVVQTSSYHDTRFLFLPELNRLDPDTLMRQVNFDPLELELLKFQRQVRPDVLYVYMMDDLITEMPRANPNYRHIPRNARFRLRQLLAHADRLIVSTEPLLELAKGMVGDLRLIPNRLRDDLWVHLESKRRTSSRPRVGWAGAQQHSGDLAYIVDVVKATAKEVDWVFFGMCPNELKPYIKEFHNFEVGVEAYPAKLASLNLDLAVAPLEIHPFNEAKSNLRILEYGILGLPVICTDIFPYRTNNAPVKCVPNQPAAWLEAIRERIHDMEATYREGDALREWVRANYLISQHLDEWYSALTRA